MAADHTSIVYLQASAPGLCGLQGSSYYYRSHSYRLQSSQDGCTGTLTWTICFGILLSIDTIGRVGTITNSAYSAYYTVMFLAAPTANRNNQ